MMSGALTLAGEGVGLGVQGVEDVEGCMAWGVLVSKGCRESAGKVRV